MRLAPMFTALGKKKVRASLEIYAKLFMSRWNKVLRVTIRIASIRKMGYFLIRYIYCWILKQFPYKLKFVFETILDIWILKQFSYKRNICGALSQSVINFLRKKFGRSTTLLQSCVTANLRAQIFHGIPNPFRESGEPLKWISSKYNLAEPNLE